MTAVDWSRWRKCPACYAAIGEPCKSIDGKVVNGTVTDLVLRIRDTPHTTRRRRSAGAS